MWLVFDNSIIFCYNIRKGGTKMIEYVYEVWYGSTMLAGGMTQENALLFVGAYFDKYYNENHIEVTIVRKVKE